MRSERLRHIADIRVSNVDKKSVEGQVPVRLCNYTDVYYNERITAALEFMESTATPEQCIAFQLAPGDVLLTKDSETPDDIGVTAVVTEAVPRLLCGYHLAMIRPRLGVDGRYLRFALTSSPARSDLGSRANGITRFGLRSSVIGDVPVPLPTHDRQRAIADHLDRETARIDALIEKKRQQIALLDESRIAIAHDALVGATVRGERADSGHRWLGSMPVGWRMVRIGALFDVQLGRMLNQERASGPDARPYIRNVNVRWGEVDLSDVAEMDFPPDARRQYRLEPGDLLVNEGGAGIGRAAIWRGQVPEMYFQKSVHRVRPRTELPVGWLLEWLRVAVDRSLFAVEGNLATIPHVPAEALRAHRVPCPPPALAIRLLADVDSKVAEVSRLTAGVARQVDLLVEKRQALITATVTGQISIPGAA